PAAGTPATAAGTATAAWPATALGPRRARVLSDGGDTATAARIDLAEPRRLLLGAFIPGGHDLALVDPDLDADPAGLRLSFREAVIDVRAQGVQGNGALGVLLGAQLLRAAEATAATNAHALGARAHRR